MRILQSLALLAIAWAFDAPAYAQGSISDLPRKQTLIVENPEGTVKNAGWFNIWAVNAGGQSTGLHQLGMDTFWYIDPNSGVDGVWDNSLASEKPIYNADFTEMTVKLRKGIFWSDGVEFSAADVMYTIETHMKTPGLPLERRGSGERRQHQLAGCEHRRLQAEEAEFALPRAVHRALERDVDDAEAHLREGRRPDQIRLRPAGHAGCLCIEQLRSERCLVHLAQARGLAADHRRPLRRARTEIRRLC